VGPPEAKACPIASPAAELTVTLADPADTSVAVTDTRGWVRENVALVGNVVLLLPNAALKVTTFPAIDTMLVWVPVKNMPAPRPVVSATVMVFPLLERTDTVTSTNSILHV
jgi:hypothetical protein